MKTIGLIGGMSWESSVEYYRIINEKVRERLGGFHSADSLMYSVDFDDVEKLQTAGQWDEATDLMIRAARRLERGGADFGLICTNTMHLMFDAVQASVNIPLLHIADATAERVRAAGLKRPALLGTRYTMERDFYKGRLTDRFGLDVLIPDEAGRETVHRVIYDELVLGIVRPESKAAYVQVIDALVARGADSLILGCTEIALLIGQQDCAVPVFDTTRVHAEAAVDFALQPEVF